jgi:uncharacterized delta-60 repeat protein
MIAGSRREGALKRSLVFAVFLAALVTPTMAQARPGDLDRSFGGDGKVATRFGGGGGAAGSMVIDSRGRIVVAGAGGRGFALARYHRGGRLDRSFSDNGKITTGFGTAHAGASSVAIDSQGRIVTAGSIIVSSGDFRSDFALARYEPDGSLDLSFSGDGKVRMDFGSDRDFADAMAIDSRDRIVVVGRTLDDNDRSVFALARYLPNGSLDPSFGSGGKVTTRFRVGNDDYATSVAIDSHGRIVAAGSALFGPADSTRRDFALVRYHSDGSLDASFGSGGKLATRFGRIAGSVVLDSRGRIVAAGIGNAGGGGDDDGDDLALARYHSDGSLDLSFGSGGKVLTDFGGRYEQANAAAIDSQGRIVAAGQIDFGNNTGDFGLARYHGNGILDRSFSGNGKVRTNFGGDDSASSVVIQSQGRIVAAGGTAGRGRRAFELAGYVG